MTAPEDKNQEMNYIVDSLYHGHGAMTRLPHHAVPNRAYNQVRASNVDLLGHVHEAVIPCITCIKLRKTKTRSL